MAIRKLKIKLLSKCDYEQSTKLKFLLHLFTFITSNFSLIKDAIFAFLISPNLPINELSFRELRKYRNQISLFLLLVDESTRCTIFRERSRSRLNELFSSFDGVALQFKEKISFSAAPERTKRLPGARKFAPISPEE